MVPRLISLLGLLVFLALAWVLSNKKKVFPWRTTISGLALMFVFALFMLKTESGLKIFKGTQDVVGQLNDFSDEGAKIAFGPLAKKDVLRGAFGPGEAFVFAVSISATIILISALSALLYYWGVLQRIVGAMAWVMRRVMRTSGSESLAAASNIFLGQTEAALLVKPYIPKMTRSEIMALMTGGMATIATGVMVVYPSFGMSAGHILIASILCAPASLFISKIMYPETERSASSGGARMVEEKLDANSLDALCRGTSEGVMLSINVMGMLIAFTAVVALFNACFVGVQGWFGVSPEHTVNMQKVFGWANAPFAWLMGVSPEHCTAVGQTLGERVVLNEFVGYLSLSKIQPVHWETFHNYAVVSQMTGSQVQYAYLGTHLAAHGPVGMVDTRSFTIATYALCGFANFASIAIQIGGIGAMAPTRRHDLARIGLKAMIGGLLSCYITAAMIGILI
jgi:CNT family concentrative nucleoside transporter